MKTDKAIVVALETGLHTRMTICPDIIAQLSLPDIKAVIFYTRDEITTDLISCDVKMRGRICTFHEMIGWGSLTANWSARQAAS